MLRSIPANQGTNEGTPSSAPPVSLKVDGPPTAPHHMFLLLTSKNIYKIQINLFYSRYKWYQYIPLYALFLRMFTSLQNHQHIRSIKSDLETVVLKGRVVTLRCSSPSLSAVTAPKHQTTIHQYRVNSTHTHLRMCINFSGKITSKDKGFIQYEQPHRIFT